LCIRERLVEGFKAGLVVPDGLAAHGRGEAFDYVIGEKTAEQAKKAVEAAAAMLLSAKRPVISVNGNVAALVPDEVVKLADATGAKLEVNLFHGSAEREAKIAEYLRKHGAKEVFGIDKKFFTKIEEIHSDRRKVDRRGIAAADVVLVPLEDGDRTEALKKMGKKVITIDMNPMSRTARAADITIVDNIVRALPRLIRAVRKLSQLGRVRLRKIVGDFDNTKNLKAMVELISKRLKNISR
jgi:4-phosphopantoate--beta-alanine ligase